MDNIRVYILLTIFCLSVFGAGIGEAVHLAEHLMDGSYHQKITRFIHTHSDETHRHSFVTEFFAEVFKDNNNDFSLLWNLNLLMLVINALLSEGRLQLNSPLPLFNLLSWGAASFISSPADVPTPPPKWLS